jgi:YgiT-type zinc finger domain-containing protein
MKYAICRHGITTEGYTTIVLERDQTTIVFKKVPAQICGNCGKEYVSAAVNKALLGQAHEEWERGIILEMLYICVVEGS